MNQEQRILESRDGNNLLRESGIWLGDAKYGTLHDLGNHIQIALSAMRMLKRDPGIKPAPQMRFILAQASASLERAGTLVHRTLGSARPDWDGLERVRVSNCLRQIESLTAFVRRPGVVFETKVETDLPMVRCSRTDLENALLNLSFNALDAMPYGGVLSITASVIRVDGAIVAVEIRVADSGSGMTKEILGRAFDFNFTTKERGTGLGLFMVKRFVHNVGGNVAIQSRPGAGTLVTLRLPAEIGH
jgi:signal transduction histidine kinase